MGLSRLPPTLFLALIVLLLFGCASTPRAAQRMEAPGSTLFRDIHVTVEAKGDGVLVLGLENEKGSRIEAKIGVPETSVGNQTVTESLQIGFREEEVCEGSICRIVKVPMYEDVERQIAVPGIFEIEPAKLVIPPDGIASASVMLRNPDAANRGFTLTVLLTITDAEDAATLEISMDSAVFLRRVRP